MAYASDTKVDADQSINQIRNLLRRHKASEIVHHERRDGATILFKMLDPDIGVDLPVTLRVDFPDLRDEQICLTATGKARKGESLRLQVEKEYRRRWRVIFLLVKAKLVAISEGGSSVRKEFIYDILVKGGATMGVLIDDALLPAIEGGKFKGPLLGAGR